MNRVDTVKQAHSHLLCTDTLSSRTHVIFILMTGTLAISVDPDEMYKVAFDQGIWIFGMNQF